MREHKVFLRMIMSVQAGTPRSSSLSLQSQKAAAEENAESETGSLRMNNAAMNEAAALCHDMVQNYTHTSAILTVMCIQLTQNQPEGASPNFAFFL